MMTGGGIRATALTGRPSIGPFWAASAGTLYVLGEEFRSDIVVMETTHR